MKITWWVQKPNVKYGWRFWKPHKWTVMETGKRAYTFFFIFIGITIYL